MQLFSSRDGRYRTPFGAVEQGTEIFFRICLPRFLHCCAARLLHRRDDGLPEADGMFWAGMEGSDNEWWDCRYTPAKPGLYWYAFSLDTDQGEMFLNRLPDGSAELTGRQMAEWQLTCYATGFRTPDWPAGGILYQIFPDRFAASGAIKEGVPDDRILREDWGGQPVWHPDASGIVRNNDYFGGDLRGIREKLPYLKSLGVTCLYLNPIFEAHSNHRYDTADYSRIDPLLGNEEEFRLLAQEAEKQNIRLMLDGVFSHTGADSRYFNSNGRYPTEGAYQSMESPYADWYHFKRWPDQYTGWWGFPTLPEVDELNPQFLEYITGKNGIVRNWLRAGASAWRLDVADELPDGFLKALRVAVKAADPEGMVLGEVWEDASNKQSYGHRRQYLLGEQLDSVMNYPFRTAILEFVRNGGGTDFVNRILTVLENYPPQVVRLLMNSLGTHDTERAITALAGDPVNGRGRAWQAQQKLSPQQRICGVKRLKMASLLQYTLPGVPCLYYGDEAGMEGYQDPFNRGCYPWGEEDKMLMDWFCRLGVLRTGCAAFRDGDFTPLYVDRDMILYERRGDGEAILCAVNRSEHDAAIPLPEDWDSAQVILGEGRIENGLLHFPAQTGIAAKNVVQKIQENTL